MSLSSTHTSPRRASSASIRRRKGKSLRVSSGGVQRKSKATRPFHFEKSFSVRLRSQREGGGRGGRGDDEASTGSEAPREGGSFK